MKTYHPPKNTLFLWQLRVFIALMLFIAVTSWIWVLTPYFTVIAAAAVLVAAFFVFFYIPKYIREYSITLGENALILKSGVFVHHERIMPYPRLVYTERQQTLLARGFRVSGLILRATRAVTITIEFGNRDVAEILEAMSE